MLGLFAQPFHVRLRIVPVHTYYGIAALSAGAGDLPRGIFGIPTLGYELRKLIERDHVSRHRKWSANPD